MTLLTNFIRLTQLKKRKLRRDLGQTVNMPTKSSMNELNRSENFSKITVTCFTSSANPKFFHKPSIKKMTKDIVIPAHADLLNRKSGLKYAGKVQKAARNFCLRRRRLSSGSRKNLIEDIKMPNDRMMTMI